MLQFLSNISTFQRTYSISGFSDIGEPVFGEKTLSNIRYPISPYSILVIWLKDIVTQDTIDNITPFLKRFDGIHCFKNIKVDLDIMLPFADKIIYFYAAAKNYKQFYKFVNIKYLCIAQNKINNLNHIHKLIDLVSIKTDMSLVNFGRLNDIIHIHFHNCRNLSSLKFDEQVSLKYLHISSDRDTNNLDFIKNLKKLEIIGLYKVSKLSIWPDSSSLINLRYVDFDNVNRLEDISGLSKSPALEYVTISNTIVHEKLLEQLTECKSLKKVIVYARSTKEENHFRKILGEKYFDQSKDIWPYPSVIVFSELNTD